MTYNKWRNGWDEYSHAALVILQALQFSFLSSLDAFVQVDLTLLINANKSP